MLHVIFSSNGHYRSEAVGRDRLLWAGYCLSRRATNGQKRTLGPDLLPAKNRSLMHVYESILVDSQTHDSRHNAIVTPEIGRGAVSE